MKDGLLSRDDFSAIAEETRRRAEDLCVAVAKDLQPGKSTEAYAQQVMFASLSGLAAAIGNGLAGLDRTCPGFAKSGLPALKDQVESSFRQGVSMRSAVND
jgi:hypothetical protein